MQRRTDPVHAPEREAERPVTVGRERRPYTAPRLESLGSWTALTLEQSVGLTFIRALLVDLALGWHDDH